MIIFAVYLGIISRWHGGGFIGGSPKSLKNLMWALPFAFVTYVATQNWYWSAFALILCTIGKATGHGTGMDLGRTKHISKPERLELTFLKPYLPEWLYDGITLSVVGLAAVSGAVIAIGTINPLYGAVIAIGGLCKFLAYGIGWGIYPNYTGRGIKNLNHSTEIGEFLTGAFAGLALGIVYESILL